MAVNGTGWNLLRRKRKTTNIGIRFAPSSASFLIVTRSVEDTTGR